ncbi:F-box only protein 7 [Frankliniella fusca]|uniref:F-box only protein 7 n=1 Tax=Frankliniella fusca TaxID=407009 RepID=A0AAE1HD62_9NEOP|nr:F-box only protein 7 [Frankliniella fusca]
MERTAPEAVEADTGQLRQGVSPAPDQVQDSGGTPKPSSDGILQDLVQTMAAERAGGKAGPGVVCSSSLLLSLLLAHLLQAGFRPQLQAAAPQVDHADPAPAPPEEAAAAAAAAACAPAASQKQSARLGQRPRPDAGPRPRARGGQRGARLMRAFRPMPYHRSLQLEHQERRQRAAGHLPSRRFLLGRRAPHPALVSARAAQVARVRAAARVVVDGVADSARAIRGMLDALLPEAWPKAAAPSPDRDKQFSVSFSLPPFTDCSFRLVAARAGYADVMLLNLSLLWDPDAAAAAGGGPDGPSAATTYSLALPVGDFVSADGRVRDGARLADMVSSALSRPAMCAARTAHGVVNPSLLGLPLRAVRRVLACLPAPDVARVAACCRALRTLANDPGLWRYMLTRDFGPLALARGALAVGEGAPPEHAAGAVDYRAEYRRLFRQRSALQIRRPSSDCRYYLPLRPLPLHDSVHSFHRQQLQQLQLQSTSSLGLIREDNGSPTEGAASPPSAAAEPPLPLPLPARAQGQKPLSLQSFYSSSTGAAPSRTRSAKSTTSKSSSVVSSKRAKRRVQPAPAAEEVVKVGSKVYKALVGAAHKSPVTAPTPSKVIQRKSCLDRRRQQCYSDDKFNSAEFGCPSISSSRASSSGSRSFCKVSSGRSFSLSGSFLKKLRRQPQAQPQGAHNGSRAAEDKDKTPTALARSRARQGQHGGRRAPEASPSPAGLLLSEQPAYAPADDPKYERLVSGASTSAHPSRTRAAPSKTPSRPAAHSRAPSGVALRRPAPAASAET